MVSGRAIRSNLGITPLQSADVGPEHLSQDLAIEQQRSHFSCLHDLYPFRQQHMRFQFFQGSLCQFAATEATDLRICDAIPNSSSFGKSLVRR